MDDIAALRQVPLFSRMQDEEIAGIRALMDKDTFEPGEVIIQEGAEGDYFYIVADGHVQSSVRNAEGRELILANIGPGGFFGELSMLTGEPRTARVRALDNVTTLALDRNEFFQFLQKHPHAAIAVLTILGHRLHHTDALLRQSVSRNVNDVDAEKMTFGQRVADNVATAMGSWPFIIVMTFLLATWITVNYIAWIKHWDPYPFVLLNLMISFQAAYAGPIIMMSQNRQSSKDRLAAEIDHQVNTKAEVGIGLLSRRLDDLELLVHKHHQEHCTLLRAAVSNGGANGNQPAPAQSAPLQPAPVQSAPVQPTQVPPAAGAPGKSRATG